MLGFPPLPLEPSVGFSQRTQAREDRPVDPAESWNYLATAMKLGSIHGKTMGKPWENGDLMGFNGFHPLVMTNITIENDHRNSGTFHNKGDFSQLC